MSELEDDIVTPNAPALYHRYVDDCVAKRKKDHPDELLEQLNSYHPNIKFTVEDNPSHFLDTQFQYKDGKFERSVYKKPGKIPTHWSSKIANKCNAKKCNNGCLAPSETFIKQPWARHQRNTHQFY